MHAYAYRGKGRSGGGVTSIDLPSLDAFAAGQRKAKPPGCAASHGGSPTAGTPASLCKTTSQHGKLGHFFLSACLPMHRVSYLNPPQLHARLLVLARRHG